MKAPKVQSPVQNDGKIVQSFITNCAALSIELIFYID